MKTRSSASVTPTQTPSKTKKPQKAKVQINKKPPQKHVIAKPAKPIPKKKTQNPVQATKIKEKSRTARNSRLRSSKSKKKQSKKEMSGIELEIKSMAPPQNKEQIDPLSQVMTLEAEVSNIFAGLENQKTILESNIDFTRIEKPMGNPIPNIMPGLEPEINNNNNNVERGVIKIKTSQFVNEKQGKFMDDYKIIKEIGSGSFGKVYKVQHLKFIERVFAMKMIRKRSSDDVALIEREINSLKRLDHPNIMKVLEFYQDDNSYYLILEYCEGQELFDYLINKGTFNEKNACFILKQLLSSVSHAHKNKIVHRDLKPENIMIQGSDLNIKIIDWGFATIFNSQETLKENFGTAFYVAPEVLSRRYNEKCDIWSCGIILYIMLIGSPPITYSIKALKEAQIIQKNQNMELLKEDLILKKLMMGNYDLKIDYFSQLSSEVKDLLKQMLNRNVELRPTATEVLAHPWFKMFDAHKNDQNLMKNLENTLINLKKFKADQKLLQAVLAYMAYQGALKEDEGRLRGVFKELDLNGDGELQREEILFGYKKIMGEKQAEEELDKIMEALDIDHNNSISYTEFILATMNKKKVITEERIKEAFDMFDENKNGSISLEEIKKGKIFEKQNFKKILKFWGEMKKTGFWMTKVGRR